MRVGGLSPCASRKAGPQPVGVRRDVRSAIDRSCRESRPRRLVDEAAAWTGFPLRQRADLQDPFPADARAEAPLPTGGSGMKLVWIGALLLLFASVANLISNRKSGRLIDADWATAGHVLPESKLLELQRAVPACTAHILGRF